jgi:hypothetical protein
MANPGHRQHVNYCSRLRLFVGIRIPCDTFAFCEALDNRLEVAPGPTPRAGVNEPDASWLLGPGRCREFDTPQPGT